MLARVQASARVVRRADVRRLYPSCLPCHGQSETAWLRSAVTYHIPTIHARRLAVTHPRLGFFSKAQGMFPSHLQSLFGSQSGFRGDGRCGPNRSGSVWQRQGSRGQTRRKIRTAETATDSHRMETAGGSSAMGGHCRYRYFRRARLIRSGPARRRGPRRSEGSSRHDESNDKPT